jgi:hypothetical protein
MHHASVVLFLVILIATVPRAGAQNSKDAPGAKGAKSASPMPSSDQLTNIPYFSLRDGMNSTLTLNNIVPSTMPVTVTIYNHEGRAQVLDPIIVPPLSFKQIDLRDVVPSDLFEEGNIQVSYSGMPMAVTCQLTVFSIDKKVSFESREQDMMDFMSSRLNGIAWLPGDAAGFLALTNTAPNKVTIGLSIGSEKSEVILSPRQTRAQGRRWRR